jgi:serine/threonine protein phosphatase PrpC/DNA-binding transcriptional MerR regulator
MDLLNIGQFAKASRLSAKALRLYDDLGLLPPAHVDPVTGYRFYALAQLERARLVLWLRQLGMPLAQIRTVCDLTPAAAATEISRFWDQVEAETASRRDLAGFLIGLLTEREAQETSPGHPSAGLALRIRYAAGCDIGLVRGLNQDAAHAGPRLLAVADGFGAGGGPASTAAIDSLLAVTADPAWSSGDLLNALADAAETANRTIGGLASDPDAVQVTGTTLTAMAVTGSQLALVHIGDSRAYMLREGDLFQVTHDHTVVQALVDEGRLTKDEAASHPQRAMLLRCLDGRPATGLDLRLHQPDSGDRYLLCSDGVSAVISDNDIQRVLSTAADPEEAVTELMTLVHAAGAPDNVSCVVADIDPTRA